MNECRRLDGKDFSCCMQLFNQDKSFKRDILSWGLKHIATYLNNTLVILAVYYEIDINLKNPPLILMLSMVVI